ncbi:MAG: kelch repeat-containing protein [Candidatus Omnitrophota bacterium]
MWDTTEAPLLGTPGRISTTAIGKLIYTLCGDHDAHSWFKVTDTTTGNSAKLPMPSFATGDMAMAAMDDRYIWCFGGSDKRGATANVIGRFDAVEKKWVRVAATLPTPRRNATALVVVNDIWIVGGYPWTADIDVYNMTEGTCTKATELPGWSTVKWSGMKACVC